MKSEKEFVDELIAAIWKWFEPPHLADDMTRLYVRTKILPCIRVRVAEAWLEQINTVRTMIEDGLSLAEIERYAGRRIKELEAELAALKRESTR